MNNRIKEYSNEVPHEQREVFRTSPKDDVDWALLMYLFRHSTPSDGCIFEEKNIITVGKVASYFDMEYDDTYKRLRRMLWWVNVHNIDGYYRWDVNVCSITEIGIRAIMKTMEIFELEEKKRC